MCSTVKYRPCSHPNECRTTLGNTGMQQEHMSWSWSLNSGEQVSADLHHYNTKHDYNGLAFKLRQLKLIKLIKPKFYLIYHTMQLWKNLNLKDFSLFCSQQFSYNAVKWENDDSLNKRWEFRNKIYKLILRNCSFGHRMFLAVCCIILVSCLYHSFQSCCYW